MTKSFDLLVFHISAGSKTLAKQIKNTVPQKAASNADMTHKPTNVKTSSPEILDPTNPQIEKTSQENINAKEPSSDVPPPPR